MNDTNLASGNVFDNMTSTLENDRIALRAQMKGTSTHLRLSKLTWPFADPNILSRQLSLHLRYRR
jgi:hypothetical protein